MMLMLMYALAKFQAPYHFAFAHHFAFGMWVSETMIWRAASKEHGPMRKASIIQITISSHFVCTLGCPRSQLRWAKSPRNQEDEKTRNQSDVLLQVANTLMSENNKDRANNSVLVHYFCIRISRRNRCMWM